MPSKKKDDTIETHEVVPQMDEHVEVYYDEYGLDFGFRHWQPTTFVGGSRGFSSSDEAVEFATLQLPGLPIEFNCR